MKIFKYLFGVLRRIVNGIYFIILYILGIFFVIGALIFYPEEY